MKQPQKLYNQLNQEQQEKPVCKQKFKNSLSQNIAHQTSLSRSAQQRLV